MLPHNLSETFRQDDLFRMRLGQILNRQHPLYKLSETIKWSAFEEDFGKLFVPDMGRPGLPIRLVVGLHYLKHLYNTSDEGVVEMFLENPYWQHFCGYEYFQHEFPCDPTSLVKWRKRVGVGGMEELFSETLEAAKRAGILTEREMRRVNVDTTVQEKAIQFPTDARLYQRMREVLVREAKAIGIKFRQSYERLGKLALIKQARYSHARQMRRARREVKKLKVYLGRVLREIKRKVPKPDDTLKRSLAMAERLLNQKRDDHNKIYSVHAPEVECIAKGKAHKKYEFGCKVSLVSTSKKGWVVGIDALHDNPYDGHTLKRSINQMERVTGYRPWQAFVDKGYRGSENHPEDVEVFLSGRRGLKKSLKRWLKRRQAIEPLIGHLKAEHGLERNHLLGKDGDRINAMLSGSAFNLRKLMRVFFLFIFGLDIFVDDENFTTLKLERPVLMVV